MVSVDVTYLLREILNDKNEEYNSLKQSESKQKDTTNPTVKRILNQAFSIRSSITQIHVMLTNFVSNYKIKGGFDKRNLLMSREFIKMECSIDDLVVLSKNALEGFKQEVNLEQLTLSTREFFLGIYDILINYLKNVVKFYTSLKKKKLRYSESNRSLLGFFLTPAEIKRNITRLENNCSDQDKKPAILSLDKQDFCNYHWSEEELRQSNQQIYLNMTSASDETQMVLKRMNEIAELQQLFSEKLHEQADQVEQINENVEQSAEMITQGNAYIRKARSNINSYQRWIIMMLIALTISLLMLDAISD